MTLLREGKGTVVPTAPHHACRTSSAADDPHRENPDQRTAPQQPAAADPGKSSRTVDRAGPVGLPTKRTFLPRQLLAIADVASRLNVSIKTVRRWIERGELRIYELGTQLRVSEDELAIFLQQRHRMRMKRSTHDQ